MSVDPTQMFLESGGSGVSAAPKDTTQAFLESGGASHLPPIGSYGLPAGSAADKFYKNMNTGIIPSPQNMADRGANSLAESGHPIAATALHTLPTALSLMTGARFAMKGGAPEVDPTALEEGHPLTDAARSETEDMQTHADAAKAAGIDLPPREVSPAQAYVNNAARRDLNLPANAPVTDGLLDAAKKQNVSPAYEAAKKTPTFTLGPKYEDAISGVNLEKIDPEWRPPTDGTMTGARAVELSSQLRSVARGMYEDAGNPNLTYAQRTDARTTAQAHYQAAKAVEGGFKEAAAANDAARSAATGTTATAGTDIADAWDKARIYNAKTEAWRGALDGAGNVSGPKIKKLLNDEPVTGPMKEVGSVVAQYPELFRSTRLQTPAGEGMVKKGIRATAPIVGAAAGNTVLPGALGSAGGAALGEYAARKMLGPPR